MKEDTSVNVENPQWWEKPRQSTNCRIHYERDYNNGSTRATTSCTSLLATRGGYNGGNYLSLSLSHSLTRSISAHALYNYFTKVFNNYSKMCALSHIYTYMTFGLFT